MLSVAIVSSNFGCCRCLAKFVGRLDADKLPNSASYECGADLAGIFYESPCPAGVCSSHVSLSQPSACACWSTFSHLAFSHSPCGSGCQHFSKCFRARPQVSAYTAALITVTVHDLRHIAYKNPIGGHVPYLFPVARVPSQDMVALCNMDFHDSATSLSSYYMHFTIRVTTLYCVIVCRQTRLCGVQADAQLPGSAVYGRLLRCCAQCHSQCCGELAGSGGRPGL